MPPGPPRLHARGARDGGATARGVARGKSYAHDGWRAGGRRPTCREALRVSLLARGSTYAEGLLLLLRHGGLRESKTATCVTSAGPSVTIVAGDLGMTKS